MNLREEMERIARETVHRFKADPAEWHPDRWQDEIRAALDECLEAAARAAWNITEERTALSIAEANILKEAAAAIRAGRRTT